MSEQNYLEQFSGYQSTDDAWWHTWAIVHSGYIHKEYRTEQEALDEQERLNHEYPRHSTRIVFTENAGFGDMRFRQLSYPIFPIGGFNG